MALHRDSAGILVIMCLAEGIEVSNMMNKRVFSVVLCLSGVLAGAASADQTRDKAEQASLKDSTNSLEHGESVFSGCYDVLRGRYEVSRAVFEIDGMNSDREIGRYRMVISKDGERRTLAGALLGHPFDEAAGGFVTRHILGTRDRIGSVTSNEGLFTIDVGSCPDDNGNPQFAEATEQMMFDTAIGTGAFRNIESGLIVWKGTVNGCDDPENRVADFTVEEGQLCFAP